MKKLLTKVTWVLFILVILASLIYFRPAWTASIPSVAGSTSVASLERITLGHLSQSVLIRSQNIQNPILLFVHGGPGMPMMYLSHTFQRPLEKKFTVVQWDQRASGKSYSDDISPETINVEQYLADALQLIDTLRLRYHQQKIYIAGHSWGTYLCSILVQRHPELFYAYISIGQVVDGGAAATIQRAFLTSEAQQHGDTILLGKLKDTSFHSFENGLFKYGGELRHATGYLPLVITGLQATEYTFRDVLQVSKGPKFCARYMRYNSIQGTIMNCIQKYDVPVFFLAGTHDYTTPFSLIKEYFDSIQAPYKQLVWFHNSAHFPFYEEPDKFDSVLLYVRDVAGK